LVKGWRLYAVKASVGSKPEATADVEAHSSDAACHENVAA